MAYATYSDVETRLGRPLSTEEQTQATTLLADAEILIKARIPDLADKIAENEIDTATVVMVEASAVVRLMRNPDGFIAESDGDYSYQKDKRLATGALSILEHEWALLGISKGIFLIAPKVPTPFELYRPEPDHWYVL